MKTNQRVYAVLTCAECDDEMLTRIGLPTTMEAVIRNLVNHECRTETDKEDTTDKTAAFDDIPDDEPGGSSLENSM